MCRRHCSVCWAHGRDQVLPSKTTSKTCECSQRCVQNAEGGYPAAHPVARPQDSTDPGEGTCLRIVGAPSTLVDYIPLQFSIFVQRQSGYVLLSRSRNISLLAKKNELCPYYVPVLVGAD